MSHLQIYQFLCHSDNIGILLHDPRSGLTAAIDTPQEEEVRRALQKTGWRLTHIFTTHHHYDHVDGHIGLKRETGCVIYGPEGEKALIPGLDHAVKEGDKIPFGAYEVEVIETPGHTRGAATYYIAGAGEGGTGVAFTGDTLFSVGCGRVFEGTYAQMFASLQKIAKLPPSTQMYCGHEYTASNIRFALSVEPDNAALQRRRDEVAALQAAGRFSLPVALGAELQTNPFLRPQSATIRASLGLGTDAPDEVVFEQLRKRKDRS